MLKYFHRFRFDVFNPRVLDFILQGFNILYLFHLIQFYNSAPDAIHTRVFVVTALIFLHVVNYKGPKSPLAVIVSTPRVGRFGRLHRETTGKTFYI